MALETISLELVSRGYLHVLRLQAVVHTLFYTAIAAVGDFAAWYIWDWPHGVIAGPVLLIGLWSILIAADRKWHRIGFAYTGRELHVGQGWLERIHSIVPIARIQHIDISRSLFERWFGVATLVVHTAGSAMTLPGLPHDEAEAIRDDIRPRLTAEPW
ncbi:PH domain-containing protein [Sphingosinithalassobacter portus]|uniref:PH domain-containing protein n=1 Tax=Stakelama portus TaxID=2676234 RepID=UPI00137AB22E|nr:PH domain-containing protein [Sphingosinithalassobacter portus]